MSDENVTCSSGTEACRPFQLLLLPMETQLQIYRFAWLTEPVEELPSTYYTHDLRGFIERATDKNDLIQREIRKKVNEELSAVRTMGAVCHHMRNTVYEEYFSRTQAVLQSNDILFQHLPSNIPSLRVSDHGLWVAVCKSTLVSEHIRHACLVIVDGHFVSERGWMGPKLRWLMTLRKLTTLEIVFEQSGRYTRLDGWRKGLPAIEQAKFVIQSLPCLRKLMFRLKWAHPYPQGEAIVWEEFPWFLELRQVFLENATVSEGAEQRCFKFENHIGVTYHDWPCSYKI